MTDNPNEITVDNSVLILIDHQEHRRKQMEKPIDLVSRFCDAWANDLGADDLAAFFTDDAVYHNIPFEPVTGRKNIAHNIASFIRPGRPGIERIEFRVINIAASGPIVMTERVDIFTLGGRTFDLQVMGTFEVNDGKINAWRDYYDPSQFKSQMAGAAAKGADA
jgi:limonene-1,2-epoxide hydrolase